MDEPQINLESPAVPDSPSPKLAPDFAAASQPSYSRVLFLGANGLRPGWGFAFYAVMFYVLQRFTSSWGSELTRLWPALSPRLLDAAFEMASLVAAFVPALLLATIEKRPWGVYGLPIHRAFGKLFWLGAFWGFSGITILIVALYGLHDFDFGGVALHGMRVAKLAAYWAMLFLLVGLFEEFLLRGCSQFTLARGIGFWPAAATLSITFGLFHLQNEGEHWRGLLAAAGIGFFFCLTLRRTGSLWFAVGFHAAWDWGETFFYSVPDSGIVYPRQQLLSSSLHGSSWLTGGTVGPEGSALCWVLIAVLWIAFDRTFPRATPPDSLDRSSDSGVTFPSAKSIR
jgi:membrane protease YdiL (CAAX protease family)